MYPVVSDANIRRELLHQWGSGQIPIPDSFWDVARPGEILTIGQAARECGQLGVIDAVAQCAFTKTVTNPNDTMRAAFAEVFAAIELGHPGNTGLQS